MYAPHYTTDERRIARLVANWQAGRERELLPRAERERFDLTALQVPPAHLAGLFENAFARMMAIKSRKASGGGGAAFVQYDTE